MLKTRLTELLGIEYPIQCGTMQGITRAELVSAVANAGGFSCIPAATFPEEEELLDEIKKTKDMTDKPFGVNVSLFPALMPRPAEELIDTVIESGVKIIETAGRNPQPYREQIADAGLIHIHKCARVRDAVKVDRLGVDAVSIVGTECGGHPSMEGVTSLVLIPQAVDGTEKPLIAGGGFSDGRSLVVALALGAEGVNMGTRFMGTKECTVPDAVKQKMIESPETSTVIVMQSLGNPSRVLRNAWAEKILEMENRGASFEELAPLISGEAGRTGWLQGDLDKGLFSVGQVVGRIHDIPSVAELMQAIVSEAMEVKERLIQTLSAD
ncbi:MAG: nitronate monooxygenase [Deltaproteobacteria bacterium]|nr:nitronate monooxygenase [Deltaproteobacteria bacterium]MBW2085775.1 nitronate monooxygenase [Deltaproteobacteria bacterium]